jgi:hypothetical protein
LFPSSVFADDLGFYWLTQLPIPDPQSLVTRSNASWKNKNVMVMILLEHNHHVRVALQRVSPGKDAS